jgi:hypothetical protein
MRQDRQGEAPAGGRAGFESLHRSVAGRSQATGERNLPVRFFFEAVHGAFNVVDLRAFFDSEFPAGVSRPMDFVQRLVLARSVLRFAGGRVFGGPLFNFVQQQLSFDPGTRFTEVAGFFGGGLAAGATTSGDEKQSKDPCEK